ncbi:MAG: glutamate 5-kinase [Pseudomonadota bacterium]
MTWHLNSYNRIVVKIGSALLVDREVGIKRDWIASLAADIAGLKRSGSEVLVVSSGAIALGRNILALPNRSLKLEESQAAAAVGQIALGRAWSESLAEAGLTAGQILLTLGDTEGASNRRTYLNARSTISTLLKFGAVPIINENDTVATSEIRYGDNDRLAARVATMMSADLLVLLSDVDGLYSRPPVANGNMQQDAEFISHVEQISPRIEAMAGSAGSELSRGGMVTKIEAGKIATTAGTEMVITSGHRLNPLAALDKGERATWFAARQNPVAARKKWIAGQLEVAGKVTIDQGAERALTLGKSLLPAGVSAVEGQFRRGDAVSIINEGGREVARGLAGYDVDDAKRLVGRKSSELVDILGFEGRAELVHRDDMSLISAADKTINSQLLEDNHAG